MKKIIAGLLLVLMVFVFSGCEIPEKGIMSDIKNTIYVSKDLQEKQPTPTDIDYSLERHNLIRRAYWVNGQREKANSLPCEVEKPLGYVVLFTESGAVVGSFVVDGKVSSLNSYLTPDSEVYETVGEKLYGDYNDENNWIADVDGSYGENDAGIFFFTPDGKYIEWTGIYLYSDIPFSVDDPIVKIAG